MAKHTIITPTIEEELANIDLMVIQIQEILDVVATTDHQNKIYNRISTSCTNLSKHIEDQTLRKRDIIRNSFLSDYGTRIRKRKKVCQHQDYKDAVPEAVRNLTKKNNKNKNTNKKNNLQYNRTNYALKCIYSQLQSNGPISIAAFRQHLCQDSNPANEWFTCKHLMDLKLEIENENPLNCNNQNRNINFQTFLKMYEILIQIKSISSHPVIRDLIKNGKIHYFISAKGFDDYKR
eukprot:446042_1